MTRFKSPALLILLSAVLAVGACDDEETGPVDIASEVEGTMAVSGTAAAVLNQADLVTVDLGGSSLEFWPYTGRTPTLGDAADPINLVLRGGADPRILRARLMYLDGDRSAFGMPSVFPFNCTWSDAIGGTQSTFATGFGWSGSAVQLQCGTYDPARLHLRFFPFGDWTVANSHFDLLIPGTTDHEVVSWELAEQIAWVDFLRLGGAPGVTGVINESPTYRQILAPVFAGLPADLKGLLLATNSITADGRLVNDGVAQTVTLPDVPLAGGGADIARQNLTIDFDQVIPRPFCSGDGVEFLKVTGPVSLDQQVVYIPNGTFTSHYHAKGHLDVIQINPATGEPTSEPYRALVNQQGRSVLTDQVNMVNDIQLQMEIRTGGRERGQLMLNMSIGPHGAGDVSGSASCKT
jgi:hypothetical protein